MSRMLYLTARCSRGCELWGTPSQIDRHVRDGSCRGTAWFRRPLRSVFIQPRYVVMLQDTAAADLITPHADRETADAADRWRKPYAVWAGGHLRSPLTDVEPRVWWLAIKPYLDAGVPATEVVDLALDHRSFQDLMPEGHLDQFTVCPDCGELVVQVGRHRQASTRCRMAQAANQVVELWDDGYRDPWTAPDKPPLTWGDLQVARWKHRLAVVEFPRNNAVLIGASAGGKGCAPSSLGSGGSGITLGTSARPLRSCCSTTGCTD